MTVLVLALVFVPMLRWVARKEGDPWLGNMLLWALFAKFMFTLVRYFVITLVYNDNADASVYSGGGRYLADLWVEGNFTTDIPCLASRGPETTRISVIVAGDLHDHRVLPLRRLVRVRLVLFLGPGADVPCLQACRSRG